MRAQTLSNRSGFSKNLFIFESQVKTRNAKKCGILSREQSSDKKILLLIILHLSLDKKIYYIKKKYYIYY